MGAGGDTETNPNVNNNSSRSAGIKALKLPPFNEDKDDLDAYLCRMALRYFCAQLSKMVMLN